MVRFQVGGCQQDLATEYGIRSITDVGEDLIEGEKARPEPDFVYPGILVRDARLLILCSTDGVVGGEEFKLCNADVSNSNYPN